MGTATEEGLKPSKREKRVGWIAVGLSTAITCFWAFWGIIENFHEGWYFEALLSNLGLMFAQYLSPMLLFMGITLVSIFWPRLGVVLHLLLAVLAAWFFEAFSNAATFMLILPLAGIGALYWFGRPQPRKVALSLVVGLPLLTMLIFGVEPALRVSQRFYDGNLGARLVEGNGVAFIWAPDGPGWPRAGGNWYKAQQACQFLSADGMTLADTSQNIWRLPTVEEAVLSMARGGENSGGEWDPKLREVVYFREPDKESPLWNIYSQVIYWWTATEINGEQAYMIAYDGQVWPRSKEFGAAYLGFRCVKLP